MSKVRNAIRYPSSDLRYLTSEPVGGEAVAGRQQPHH